MAPLTTSLTLLLETAMGIALILGAFLARRRNFRAHAWCQSAVVLFNLGVIAIAMAPSIYARVAPKIPQRLGKPYYAIATTHAALGAATEFAAIYVLLAAGTHLLPAKLRLSNFKPAMRAVLVLWWIALLLGLLTYAKWYIPKAL